jgi:hypothetical protein
LTSNGILDYLTINLWINEYSDWAFSYLFIWDQNLTDSEMLLVSNILTQYLVDGISLTNLLNIINLNNNINYQLFSLFANASIFTKTLKLLAIGDNKIFDYNYNATFTYTISGIVNDDQVDISANLYYANFNNYNAGLNRLITISNVSLYGVSTSNYNILTYAYTRGNILTKPIYITPTGIDKIYDKTTNTKFTYTISGFFSGDQVDISGYYYYANFSDYNYGFDKLITISKIILYGVSSNNYNILTYAYTTANISKRFIYVTGIDKKYDGTTIATISISNKITSDNITYWGQFDTFYPGLNKIVNVALSGIFDVTNEYLLDTDINIIYYYKFDIGDVVGTTIINYANNTYAGSNIISTLIDSTDYKVGTGSLYTNGINSFSFPSFSTSPLGLSICLWYNLSSSNTQGFPRVFEFSNNYSNPIMAFVC